MHLVGVIISAIVFVAIAVGFLWVLFFFVSGLLGSLGFFVPKAIDELEGHHPRKKEKDQGKQKHDKPVHV